MEKRTLKRTSSNLEVEIYNDNSIHFGIIKNISEKGMCINVGIGFINGSGGKLLFKLQGNYAVIPFKVIWVIKSQNTCDLMGIEVLESYGEYLDRGHIFSNFRVIKNQANKRTISPVIVNV